MKKAFVIALAVLLCVTACSKNKNSASDDVSTKPVPAAAVEPVKPAEIPAQQATDAVTGATEANAAAVQGETVEDGESEDELRGIFKDPKKMTGEELEEILHKLEKCDAKNMGDWYNIRDCTAYHVFDALASGRGHARVLDPITRRSVYLKVLKESDVAAVRDFIYAQIDLTGGKPGPIDENADLDAIHQFLEIIRNEKDEIALSTAVGYLAAVDGIEKIPAACDYLFDTAAAHSSAMVRHSLVEHLDAKFKDLEKAKSAIMQLCGDSDAATSDAACGKIVEFDVPDAMKLASEYLNDAGKSGAHGAIVSSLNRMWLNVDHPDGAAYQIVHDYLMKQPRNGNLPAWSAISSLSMGDWKNKEDANYKSWESAASFYKAESFVAVLRSIIMDSNAPYLSRLNAMDQVIRFGSVEDLKPLPEELERRIDKNEERLLDDLNRKIEDVTTPKKLPPGRNVPRPSLDSLEGMPGDGTAPYNPQGEVNNPRPAFDQG